MIMTIISVNCNNGESEEMADTLEIISTDSVTAPHATISNLQFSWDKSIKF